MIKRRLERVAVTLLSVAVLLSSTGIASSLAVNEVSTSGSTTAASTSTTKSSTTISQEGGAISTTTVATEGGALVTENKGSGTVSDPYRISNVDDFLGMQDKINQTTNANKNFVLTEDIDLSSVDADKFISNSVYSGALVSLSKNLSAASKNVYFTLDGNGHKIKGLNVSFEKGESFAVFGYVNSKSTIKNLVVENCRINVATDAKNVSVLVSENEGLISGCEVKNSVLSMKNVAKAGLVAASNNGTISDVKVMGTQSNVNGASAASHTISGSGTIGAVVGTNSGKITGVSAINIGEYIPENLSGKTVYGGIVGSNSGTVSNSFASGNVVGGRASDFVGGLAGSASNGSKFINNYILVALKCKASGNALVGSGATESMFSDCYWSSSISGRTAYSSNLSSNKNDIDTIGFKVVKVGESVEVSKASLSASWGKASISISDGFTKSGDGISLSAQSIKGVSANSVSWLHYNAEVSLPSTVGTGSLKMTQSFSLPVLVVSAGAKGIGTADEPLVINNSSELGLLKYARGVYAKLGKDFSSSASAFAFNGSLDGNGHIITVSAPVFTEVCGTIKNIEFISKSDLSGAVLGNAVDVNADNVAVTVANGATFNASGSNAGIMFGTVAGSSTLDNCRVKGSVKVVGDVTNLGAVAGAIIGNGSTVRNSGASCDIASSEKASNAAIVIGSVSASNVSVENCYVSGNNGAGKYSFIADISARDTEITNVYMSKGTQLPVDFTKYSFIDKAHFKEWSFDDGEVAFFTGNGGSFALSLPTVEAFTSSVASDYSVSTDASVLSAGVTVENGKLVLSVKRVAGVVTVKGCAVTVTNKTTGLFATVKISNGLEKDSSGNYIVSNPYDLAYISENITELSKASFVVTSDIDMSELSGFAPIGGTVVSFGGKFNGNGHTVSNLKIYGTSKSGLFASLDGAEISDLVIDSADVKASGLYSAVLAGQINGNTKLINITVENSKVNSDGIYSGIIAGSVNGGSLDASNITVSGCSVNSKANYVGAVAGYANCSGSIGNANITNTTLGGAEYVGGVVGLAEGKLAIKSASVSDSKIKGVSEISGIMAGKGEVSITDVKVVSSEISTISDLAVFVAGGIASSFGSSITNAEVNKTAVKSGIASAVVGRSTSDAKLSVKNAKLYGVEVTADKANTVAAGILAVHNSGGVAVINNATIDEKSEIVSSAVAAGIVGDVTGAESALVVDGVKSFADVELKASADATAAAGAIAKISASALNNVQLRNVKALGTVSGNAAVGGMLGLVKGIGSFNEMTAVISDSVCAPQIVTESTNKNAGVVIGSVENKKSVNKDNIDSLITGTVISTYFGNVPAFGASTEIDKSNVADMDKPNGSDIKASQDTLSKFGETEVTLSNLPAVKGYSFDTATGWVSEANERIGVVSSTESKLVLDVKRMADISVVAYYVLDSDSDVRIPVHFSIKANVRTPLEGEGTSASPYLIKDAYDLETVAYYDTLGKYFALAEDITFKASDFEFGGGFYNVGNGAVTIGGAESGFEGTFTGLYNGKVHSINGLKLSGNVLGGLFGATDGAVISDIVINGADVSGLNRVGVVIGEAKNTVIKNITVNSSSANSVEFGSVAGIVVGRAENVTADNITINNSTASTTLSATSATVEIAGGFAGVFNGKLSNVKMSDITVQSGTIAAGALGTASNAQLDNIEFNGSVSGKTSGGLIGLLENSNNTSIKNSFVGGTVTGEQLAAGVIGEIGANCTVSKSGDPLVEKTVVVAKAVAENSASVIAKADQTLLNDTVKATILSDVYYSSYQNESIFGTQELNSYQNEGFTATDLSTMKCVLGGTEKSFVTLSGENTVIGENDIVTAVGNGTYKSFEVLGHKFELSNVSSDPEGVLTFDKATSSVKASGAVDNAKLVFTYSNGLETAISVAYSSVLAGSGTKADPYRVGTADEFAIMMQNGTREGVYYTVTDDIDLSGVKSADSFAGIIDGGNHVVYDFSGESMFKSFSGTVKNLGLVGFDIDSKLATAVGALAGTLDGATVENCVVIADVKAAGTVQDAGIIAGRAENGTTISNSITSGKVMGSSLLAAGGIVGSSNNSQIDGAVSTAYVFAGGYAGGLVGEADYTTITRAVFGNMTASVSKKSGNVVGRFGDTSTASSVYFDGCTSANDKSAFDGANDSMKLSATKALSEPSIIDFGKTASGYAVPASLKSTECSAKFATAVEFAALAVKYISGTSVGTAMNYSDIKVPSEVNSNSVSVDRSNGLVITLMKNKDYASTDNAIERYSKPASNSTTAVTYSINDKTGKLEGKLIGVMLKSKLVDSSNAFGFFTKVGDQPRAINSVVASDEGIYIDLVLPEGYGYKVTAVNSEGKKLDVSDVKNEGRLISTLGSESIDITIEITKDNPNWGIRAIWSVIGK